ncbi:RAM signaling pathway protein-domain-containing protein [Syncephalastrum racemosum]|uniref:RAM signaling pathway protein-domain-containing protein n=1 Tax=Syncephalastrum racemosum TaxID=13706 RepID=A0A1X2H3E7_SYNRA|nr:RAM signaling pathway protein-domain-containing protein [Syncephalastrum racemosum]
MPQVSGIHRRSYSTPHETHEMDCEAHYQWTVNSADNSGLHLPVIEACRTVLFAATSLHSTLRRCLHCCSGKDGLSLGPQLRRSTGSAEKLVAVLDTLDLQPSPSQCAELVRAAASNISSLKDLVYALQARISELAQILDPKFSRHLLVTVYSATVDLKEAWDTLSPLINAEKHGTTSDHSNSATRTTQSIHSMNASNTISTATPAATTTTPTPSKPSPTTNKPPSPLALSRGRSQSTESSLYSPQGTSPGDDNPDQQLYTLLKLAIAHSLHVTDLLKHSVQDSAPAENGLPPPLQSKLSDLTRQSANAAELAIRLDKHVDIHKEELVRKELTRSFWEETDHFLKIVVSIMSSVRALITEDDFQWPKPVKQGCLQVTRVTTEVAKQWNTNLISQQNQQQSLQSENPPRPSLEATTTSHTTSSISITSSCSFPASNDNI